MKRKLIDIEHANSILNYNPEIGLFTRIKAKQGVKVGDIAGYTRQDGRTTITINGNSIRAHRLAWAMYYNEQPPAMIDHINCDPGDNRIANLRECTHSENLANSRAYKNNKSGYKGVYWNKKKSKWTAQIKKNGKVMWLGDFAIIEDAAQSYAKAAEIYHGEFARTE